MRNSVSVAISAFLVCIATTFAGVPLQMSHQGRLTDTGGALVPDGTYSITFTLYDQSTGGTPLWSSGIQQVDIVDGLFSYPLGKSVELPHTVFSDGDVWLGITVGADPELQPRTLLTGSPMAAVSASVQGDLQTSDGRLVLQDEQSQGTGDSTVILLSEMSTTDHHGHVTILKISNGGADTTELIGMIADPDQPALVVGDGSPTDTSVIVTVQGDKRKHRGHVTILKISNGGTDTTDLVGMIGDPEQPGLVVGDGSPTDTSVIVTVQGDKRKHRGHVTILKISNGGTDTTDLVGMIGDPEQPGLVVGDGSTSDTSVIVSVTGDKVKHRGHVTILKISNGGADTTEILGIEADPDTARMLLTGGDGSGGTVLLRSGPSSGSGEIGVNTMNPAYTLDVVGDMCASGGLCQQSDRRLKKDIHPFTDGLTALMRLNPVNYQWRTKEFPERELSQDAQVGFIAQDVMKVLPQVVTQGTDGFYAIDYSKLTPVLVAALQQQEHVIDSQSQDIAELRQEIANLKSVVSRLAEKSTLDSEVQLGSK